MNKGGFTVPFTWRVNRGGYRWSELEGMRSLTTVKSGQGYSEYAPLADYPSLFLTFSLTEETEAGILAFANQYGILGIGSIFRGSFEPQEWFSSWVDQVRGMRTFVARWRDLLNKGSAAPEQGWDALRADVRSLLGKTALSAIMGLPGADRGDSVHQRLETSLKKEMERIFAYFQVTRASHGGNSIHEAGAANLLNALWLQFDDIIARKAELRQCLTCGSWIVVSPDQRRSDARYCKEACRVRAYKERKKEARRLFAAGDPPGKIAKKLGSTAKIVLGWIAGGSE
jgi:hypothetical protein